MIFSSIIGNEENKEILQQIIKSGNIGHSYMFIGAPGIGKKQFAKEFAKAILCESDSKPCGNCKSCLEFENENNPDFYYVGLEENSIKIDTIRKMQQKVQELPIVSNKKVYIIDDSEFMTKEAQNCLLKTLEEPPEFVTIILITANENMILNTIKSRCLKIYFKNIPDSIVKEYIKDNYGIILSENLIKLSNGSISNAIKINDQKEDYEKLNMCFSNIEKYDLIDAIRNLEILYKAKDNILNMLDYINVLLFENVKRNIKYVNYIKCVEKTKQKIRKNCNYDMCIDYLIFSIWEDRFE